MPYIKISPPTGPLNVFYSISTPSSHDAASIIPDIPTILFIHPLYIPQQIFEAQFSDYGLRQFNLIAFDMRSHGKTEGKLGEEVYTAHEDVFHLMEALKLPPCHIFGLSMGCCVALDLATNHPDRVLSLLLCSPLSPTELEGIVSGRQEVHELLSQASSGLLSESFTKKIIEIEENSAIIDMEQVEEAIVGIKQLAFNNELNSLMAAITDSATDQCVQHWATDEEGTREGFQATIVWPIGRKFPATDALPKISCPAKVIWCREDFAYTLENAEALVKRLQDAGVKSELHQVPGSHYGCVGGSREINALLVELVDSCHASHPLPTVPLTADREGGSLKTPFHQLLEKYDYAPYENSEIALGSQYESYIRGVKNINIAA